MKWEPSSTFAVKHQALLLPLLFFPFFSFFPRSLRFWCCLCKSSSFIPQAHTHISWGHTLCYCDLICLVICFTFYFFALFFCARAISLYTTEKQCSAAASLYIQTRENCLYRLLRFFIFALRGGKNRSGAKEQTRSQLGQEHLLPSFKFSFFFSFPLFSFPLFSFPSSLFPLTFSFFFFPFKSFLSLYSFGFGVFGLC